MHDCFARVWCREALGSPCKLNRVLCVVWKDVLGGSDR